MIDTILQYIADTLATWAAKIAPTKGGGPVPWK